MRIGYYVGEWPRTSGGGGIYTYLIQLTTALKEMGHEVYFITHNVTNDSHSNIVNIRAFSSQTNFFTRLLRKLRSKFWFEIEAKNIAKACKWASEHYHLDIIEIEESFGLGGEAASSISTPVVIRLHGPWKLTWSSTGMTTPSRQDIARIKSEEKACRLATALSTPSQYALHAFNPVDLPEKLCRIIPNGINIPVAPWGLRTPHPHHILFVGRFDYLKGADLAIDAFSILANIYEDCELLLVGPDLGIRTDSKILHYEAFIETRKLQRVAHRIHYYKELDREAINHLRLCSGVTIVPSRAETFSYTTLEAMSYGCPIVASDVGGVPELIEQNHSGLLVPANDSQALASKIQYFFDHQGEAERMGRNARILAADRFNVNTFAKNTLAFYKDVVDYYRSLH